MHCTLCATELPDDDLFCESCGAPLSADAEPAACSCGARASEIDEDGYCSRCGRRARRPVTDHVEVTLSPKCAGVSDRGLSHARNEDRLAMHQCGEGYVLVVCDGVSSSRNSEFASSTVSEFLAERLAEVVKRGAPGDREAAMKESIAAAAEVLSAHPRRDSDDNPPSTTAVAAIVAGGVVTVGWVGDSRAYWIDVNGARQLTDDHSWINNVVSSGEMTLEDAERHPQAHTITRWLGADAGENAAADTAEFRMKPPGVLLLCTDGLWNYAATTDAIAGLVRDSAADGADALTVARKLVAFANSQGGQDNITAIVLQQSLNGDPDA